MTKICEYMMKISIIQLKSLLKYEKIIYIIISWLYGIEVNII